MKIFCALVTFLLIQSLIQVKSQQTEVTPVYIAYEQTVLDNTVTDSCTPYPANTEVPQGVTPTDYVQCNGPTTITNGVTGPPFYIVGESPGQILFDFGRSIQLSSVTIHYQYTGTFALAKLRVDAVPDTFEAWDQITTSVPNSIPIDAIRPGDLASEGLINLTRSNLGWNTSRILLRKLEDTKTFLFAMSEVRFIEDIQSETTASTPMTTTMGTVNTGANMTTQVLQNSTYRTTDSVMDTSTAAITSGALTVCGTVLFVSIPATIVLLVNP